MLANFGRTGYTRINCSTIHGTIKRYILYSYLNWRCYHGADRRRDAFAI